MRILIVIFSLLLAAPAFAKPEPPKPTSLTLMFARSCAHALDAEEGQDLLYREMQRWLEIYLRDPDPKLPSDHRLGNALTELYEMGVDRLADLPRDTRKRFEGYLDESHAIGDGEVPDVSDAEIFLATMTEMNHELRRLNKRDLGGAAFAGIALTVMSGTLFHDEIRVGYEDPDNVDAEHLVIEPDAHNAFTIVEQTTDELRRGRGLEILRSTVVANFANRRDAAFAMIQNLDYARAELPERIADRVGRLVELRKAFDGDDGAEKVLEFKRIVSILLEINGYVKLADQMTRVGWAIWEGERVAPSVHVVGQ